MNRSTQNDSQVLEDEHDLLEKIVNRGQVGAQKDYIKEEAGGAEDKATQGLPILK